jgi:hypothetical protein
MKVRRKGTNIKSRGKDISHNHGELITLPCKICEDPVNNCTAGTVKVTCWRCVQKMIEPPKAFGQKKSSIVKPRGWKFMKIYVDSEKNVYYKGTEQVDLKGTLEPTVVVPKPKKKKLTPREKEKIEVEKNHLFSEITQLKKELMKIELLPRQRKKIEKEIKQKDKKIKVLSKKK